MNENCYFTLLDNFIFALIIWKKNFYQIIHNDINHCCILARDSAQLTLYGSLRIKPKKANAELIMTLCIAGGLEQNDRQNRNP
jgi:hypothetical protein